MIAGAPRLDAGERFVFFLQDGQHDIPYVQGDRGLLRVIKEKNQDVIKTYSGQAVIGIGDNGFQIRSTSKEQKFARVVDSQGRIIAESKSGMPPSPLILPTFLTQLKNALKQRGL